MSVDFAWFPDYDHIVASIFYLRVNKGPLTDRVKIFQNISLPHENIETTSKAGNPIAEAA